MESLATYQGSRFGFIKVRWEGLCRFSIDAEGFRTKEQGYAQDKRLQLHLCYEIWWRSGLLASTSNQYEKRDKKLSRVLSRASSLLHINSYFKDTTMLPGNCGTPASS